MKSSLKTLIAVGALGLAATQASASSISVFNGMTPVEVTSSANPLASPPTDSNPAFYQLHTGGTAYASFTLVDTAPETNTVFYNLYADTDAFLGTYTISGPALASWSFTDILGSALGGTYSYLLAGGSQYVLKIETGGGADSVGTRTSISAVPLPAAAWLFGSALLGFGALRRKQKAGASEMAAV